MAQISINVSSQHGSSITVGRMISDDCLGFETTVYLKSSYDGAKPHTYARDTVFLHGDRMAIRSLLEKLMAALDARTKPDISIISLEEAIQILDAAKGVDA